jgi:thioredoxin 1
MNQDQHTSVTTEVSQTNFDSEVLKATLPVIVAFCAPWSRPCQILDSVLDEVRLACADNAKVVKVNADDNPDLGLWYEIESVPTLLWFIHGTPRARVVGTASKRAILSKLETVLHGGGSTPLAPDANLEDEYDNL